MHGVVRRYLKREMIEIGERNRLVSNIIAILPVNIQDRNQSNY